MPSTNTHKLTAVTSVHQRLAPVRSCPVLSPLTSSQRSSLALLAAFAGGSTSRRFRTAASVIALIRDHSRYACTLCVSRAAARMLRS